MAMTRGTNSGRSGGHSVNRRRFVEAAGGAGLLGLTGCLGDGGSGDGGDGGSGSDGGSGDGSSDGGSTGSGGDDVIEVTTWELFSGGDGEAFASLLEKFNSQHPGIELKLSGTSWNNYYSKLFASMTGGNPPDMGIIHTTRLLKFAPALRDLSSHLSSGTTDAYVDSIWNSCQVDGKRVALPLDTHPCGLYYNKDLFEEAGLDPSSPPTNWEEFKAAADAISSETDAHGFIPQPYQGPSMLRPWFMFLKQKGGNLLNEDNTQAAFNTDAGLEIMETWQNMTGDWGWDQADTSAERGTKAFRQGDAGMIYQGTWYVNAIKDAEYEWDMAKPTNLAPGANTRATWTNSHSFAVPSNKEMSDEKLEATVTAMEWITQNSTDWGKIAGHLPAASDVLNSSAMKESQWWDKTLSKFFEMANDGQIKYLPRTEKQSEFKRPIFKNIQQVYSQQKEPQAALDDAESQVNSTLG